MKIGRLAAAGSLVAATALILSGCAVPRSSEVIGGTSIKVAWNDPLQEYNTLTSTGNAATNNNIWYLANQSFNYYNSKSELVKNTDFGTYKVESEDPLTVKYTVNKDVTWSDGTPVDAADLLLTWAAQTTHLSNVEAEYDDEGNVTNQDALDKGVFFDGGATPGVGLDLVSKTPTIGDDGRSLTLVYDEYYVDWELAFPVGVSAHGTAQLAFPDKKYSGADAKKAFIKAVQDKDTTFLSTFAKAWSNDYKFLDMPKEKQKTLSNGPYTITDLKDQQYVTLTARKDYTSGPSTKYQKVIVRVIPDPQAQITALQNGEVQIAAGQPTADLLTQIKGTAGIEYKSSPDATYEHVDLQVTNGGPFDPKTYAGDAEKARLVREAFLKTVPRQDIVDKLIKPLQDDAVLRESNVFLPGTPGYEASVKAGAFTAFDTVDIEGAKANLATAGVTDPQVRLLYGSTNTRRQQQFELIRQSAALAGITVIDGGSETWGSDLSSKPDAYDAALFGWQSTSTAVGESQANYIPGGLNNFFGWDDKEVTATFKKLMTETDPAKQQALLVDAEQGIAAQAWTVPIFQFPGVTAWSDKVTGVDPAFLAPQYFWNFWDWAPSDSATKK
ncbi:ABC transporter family substrate-binding protein [Glaciibacter psychrotolerans]|uniref:Peptide/nickel transport system substrate-binding protein n=1 Tax=Glaciibacter psychrotolerans TaxID=670054 RepID=A0A7Z0J620_9MICO|nr:ABC transporter family substrate-binding protein [Leifsonia psychrotolerans]NYJ19761.1 peptide/nickel transport system substrate-binding protein [Leifsonia psychrotolerans]